MSPRRPKNGFTLVELLVVVATVLMLVALLIPVTEGVRSRSQSTACLANLRQLHGGALAYAADHQGEVPVDRTNGATGRSWYSAIKEYVPHGGYGKKKPPYFCPANPARVIASGNIGWTTYAINANLYAPSVSANLGTAPTDESRGSFLQGRRAVRLTLVKSSAVLLLDSVNGAESPGTWYINGGTDLQWTNTYAVHGTRVNVIFVDGHAEAPQVSPRTVNGAGDLNELRKAWFTPIF